MNKKNEKENHDFVLELVNNLTLYSPHIIESFKNKALIREILSLVELPFTLPEKDEEITVIVEEYRKKGILKEKEKEEEKAKLLRSQRSDVVVRLKATGGIKRSIQIEIQKKDNKDTIPRALSYMGRELSNEERGQSIIGGKEVYLLWLCDYDPFENSKSVSGGKPIYSFNMRSIELKGYERFNQEGEILDNTPYLTIINTSYPWYKIKELTEKERRLKEFALDMNQTEPNNMNSDVIREILSYYKGGGEMYYDKAQEWFDDEADKYFAKHKDALEIILRERIRAEGLEKGLEEGLEEGRKKGLEEGKKKGLEEGKKKGLEEGKKKGLEEGKKKGLEEGVEKGKLESLIDLVKKKYLSIDIAIKESGLSEEEFKKRLKES